MIHGFTKTKSQTKLINEINNADLKQIKHTSPKPLILLNLSNEKIYFSNLKASQNENLSRVLGSHDPIDKMHVQSIGMLVLIVTFRIKELL